MINFLFSPSHMPTCKMQWFFFDANPTHAFLSHQPPAPHFARCARSENSPVPGPIP